MVIDINEEDTSDVINGKMLQKYVNKNIQIMGKVNQINLETNSCIMKTTDNVDVKVVTTKIIDIIVGAFILLDGTFNGQFINARLLQVFNNQNSQKLIKDYNYLCKRIQDIEDVWIYVDDGFQWDEENDADYDNGDGINYTVEDQL